MNIDEINESILTAEQRTLGSAAEAESAAAAAWRSHGVDYRLLTDLSAGASTMSISQLVTARLASLGVHIDLTPELARRAGLGAHSPFVLPTAPTPTTNSAIVRIQAASLRAHVAFTDTLAAMIVATVDAGMLTLPDFSPAGRWPWSKRRSLLDGYTSPVTS
jgi:hypothetical protein